MTPKQAARRAMALTTSFDIAAAGMAFLLAVVLIWFNKGLPEAEALSAISVGVPLFMSCALAAIFLRGIYKHVWRHLGWPDAMAILQAVGLTALLYFVVLVVLAGTAGIVLLAPWTTLATALLLWTAALFAGRMAALNLSTAAPMQIFKRSSKNGQPVLLVGDINACADLLRRMKQDDRASKIRILGITEVKGTQTGRAVRGIPLMGSLDQLGNIIDTFQTRYGEKPWVAVTGLARQRDVMLEVLEITSQHAAKVMALSPDGANQLMEPLQTADLLSRRERQLDKSATRALLTNKRVLITGGGGTIGSELTRQVADVNPSHLALIDSCEYNLYSIHRELFRSHPELKPKPFIGDVRDPVRLGEVFNQSQPEIVIHAAALKHVPMMEWNPCEAVLTNVGGALQVARAAVKHRTSRFVFISTDKAVNPDNVMGATKRLAEMIIAREAKNTQMHAAIVRFGNVLGSSGSVVPLFEKQIKDGGPVTVTDANVTRYFMTVEEASALVLQAAALSEEDLSNTYLLDMGEPMKILQLAETMIRMKGLVPHEDIEIEVIGLREGEKIHEELTYSSELQEATPIDGVSKVYGPAIENSLFDKQLAALLEAAAAQKDEECLRLLGLLVPEYAANQEKRVRAQSA